MEGINNPIKLTEIAQNLNQYDFKCNSIIITPQIEIYQKGTNKLVATTEMSAVVLSGTMNQEYADKFFSDIEKTLRGAFSKEMNKKLGNQENGTKK